MKLKKIEKKKIKLVPRKPLPVKKAGAKYA